MGHYKGQVVTIYKDPLTKTEAEGNAKLIEKIGNVGRLELWKVYFIDNDPGITFDKLL